VIGERRLKKPSPQNMDDFHNYMKEIKGAISDALNPRLIISSFRVTGLVPFNPSVVLAGLPQVCPTQFQPTKQSKRFTLNDKELTAPNVIDEMRSHSSLSHDHESDVSEGSESMEEPSTRRGTIQQRKKEERTNEKKVVVISNPTTRRDLENQAMKEITE
jgi:hypothetical protein